MKDSSDFGLLDRLADRMGCECLSDLRIVPLWRLRVELLSAAYRGFDAHEWNDAVQYLTGEPARFEDAEDARWHLLECLGR